MSSSMFFKYVKLFYDPFKKEEGKVWLVSMAPLGPAACYSSTNSVSENVRFQMARLNASTKQLTLILQTSLEGSLIERKLTEKG